jgi:hypothetical protein
MRKFKRNTIIGAWVYAIIIVTGCFFLFYIRGVLPRKVYEDALILTLYISVCAALIFSTINRFVGNRIAKDRGNWEDVINEISLEKIGAEEFVFLISYIIFAVSLAIAIPTYLIAMWSEQLGL